MEYPSNSHESRLLKNDLTSAKPRTEDQEPEKIIKPAVQNPAQVQKVTIRSRFFKALGGIDGKTVADHLVNDIIIPAAKDLAIKTADDAVHSFRQKIRAVLLGDTRPIPRGPSVFGGGGPVGNATRIRQVPYDGYSRPTPQDPQHLTRPTIGFSSRTHNIDEYSVDTLADALNVLDVIRDLIQQFGFVSVSDYKELLRIVPEHTDIQWGWESLPDIHPYQDRNGRFRLNLPSPIDLNHGRR